MSALIVDPGLVVGNTGLSSVLAGISRNTCLLLPEHATPTLCYQDDEVLLAQAGACGTSKHLFTKQASDVTYRLNTKVEGGC